MPKRQRDKCNEGDYEYLTKKLKKLERKIARSRCDNLVKGDSDKPSPRNPLESDSIAIIDDDVDLDKNEDPMNAPGCSYWTNERQYDSIPDLEEYDSDATPPPTPPLEKSSAPLPSMVVVPPPPAPMTTTLAPTSPPPQPQPPPPPQSTTVSLNTAQPLADTIPEAPQLAGDAPELDPELMDILGEDPTSAKEYGKDIQKDLAIRLNYIVTSGLSKEKRKELKDKYLIPANCKLIKAPTLNPEIKASLIESQAKRDKGIENKQTLTSCALSSLSEAITLLLSSDNKNPELLKPLIDTARMLGDIQHADSISRRYFILSTVKKELKDQLEKTKIDETLFGSNLPETLKSAKTINKSGAELRSASTMKPFVTKSAKANSRPLNYRGPPASRRAPPAGAARNMRAPHPALRASTTLPPAPVPSTQPNASRTSSRQPPTRYYRR